ncbi:MAG: RDD family protein [Ignavibacteriota bacterium]
MIGEIARLVGKVNADVASAVSVVGFFVISVVYAIVLEWRWRGQTIGKRLFGLRVMDVHGLHLQFPQIAIRNLLRVIDMLPFLYLVGGPYRGLQPKCAASRRYGRQHHCDA